MGLKNLNPVLGLWLLHSCKKLKNKKIVFGFCVTNYLCFFIFKRNIQSKTIDSNDGHIKIVQGPPTTLHRVVHRSDCIEIWECLPQTDPYV